MGNTSSFHLIWFYFEFLLMFVIVRFSSLSYSNGPNGHSFPEKSVPYPSFDLKVIQSNSKYGQVHDFKTYKIIIQEKLNSSE